MGRLPSLFSPAAHSRLVTKTYQLKSARPSGALEMILGKSYQAGPEKEYIDEIMDICERERIDLIYPTDDDQVFLLSKHKKAFAEKGVFIPINEFEILKTVADKFEVIRLAESKGIPHPKTFLASEIKELPLREENSTEPVAIIKPRFGNASRGVFFVNEESGWKRWLEANRSNLHKFVVQEYIPGDTIVNLRVYMKRDGTVLFASCSGCRRPQLIIHQSCGIVHTKAGFPPCYEKVVSLLRDKNYFGYAHAQFKIDSRCGAHKLMEINVRIGRGTWTEMRMGVNRPLISLSLFRNTAVEVPEAVDETNVIFVYPMQDIFVFILYLFSLPKAAFKRWALRSRKTRRLPGISEMLKHYYAVYFSGRKKIECDNYFKFFFKDTLVSLTYWFSFCYQLRKKYREWDY
jgi:carbamoyl-phosphate synthase large subunit